MWTQSQTQSHARQYRTGLDAAQVPAGSTIYAVGHSGGVFRQSLGSVYLGLYGIGVARAFSEQGPAIGFYDNIGDLSANYSMGRDVTSDIGALLSPFYYGANSTMQNYSFSNARHLQGGDRGGNEFNPARAQLMLQP